MYRLIFNKTAFTFILLFTLSCNNSINHPEHKAVEEVIHQFFQSIDHQDSVLFKKIVELSGQVWIVDNSAEPSEISVGSFKEAVRNFDSQLVIREKALSIDLDISNGIATAWVPYKLWIDEKFSHCGIDAFTMVKKNKIWKIVNITYTKEVDSCDD